MKNLLFLLTILTISCTPPTPQQQLATNICDCYQPVQTLEAKMSDGYKKEFYTLALQKIAAEYKANTWLLLVEHNLKWLHANKDSLHTKTAEKKYNLVKAIMGKAMDEVLHQKSPLSAWIFKNKNVADYSNELHMVLWTDYMHMLEVYRLYRNNTEKSLDLRITNYIHILGQEEYKRKFLPPQDLYKVTREFYKCTQSFLIPAIENDFTLWSDSLRNAINDECPQAAKWLF